MYSQNSPLVFISYARKDEIWKERLVKQLRVFTPQFQLDVWDDRHLKGGDEWQQLIRESINSAKLSILMISADYLSSDFVQTEELPLLLRRHEEEGLTLYPVIVRETNWERWFGSIQVRPEDGKPLSSYKDDHPIDKVLTQIAREVFEKVYDQNPSKLSSAARPSPPEFFSHEKFDPAEECILEGIFHYLKRYSLPPTLDALSFLLMSNMENFKENSQRDMEDLFADSMAGFLRSLQSLKDRNWVAECQNRLVFTAKCHRDWPPLKISDLNHAIGFALDAEHVSTHFVLSEKNSLIAPWTTCYTCFIPFDLVTQLDRQHGLTSYMMSNNGIYNLTYQQIQDFDALDGSAQQSSSPIYGSECYALLGSTIIIDSFRIGLIKIENKRRDTEGKVFTKSDEEILRMFLENRENDYNQAYSWINRKYPNPKMYIFDESME